MEKNTTFILASSSESDVTIISESNSEPVSLKSEATSTATQEISVESEYNTDVAASDQSSASRDGKGIIPPQPTITQELPSDSAAKEIPSTDPEQPKETVVNESADSSAKSLVESSPLLDTRPQDVTAIDEDLSISEMRRRYQRERWSIICHVTGIPLFALSVGISVFTAYVYRTRTAIGVCSTVAVISTGVLSYLIFKLKQYLFTN